MLCLSRKREQRIKIGNDIEIKVLAIGNGRVRIGVTAPKEVKVLRSELKRNEAA